MGTVSSVIKTTFKVYYCDCLILIPKKNRNTNILGKKTWIIV